MNRLRALAFAFLTCPAVAAADIQPEHEELKRLSVEQLMQIDVTTATRRAEPVLGTAAAVTVITGEQIHRSGVTTVADALRLANGVHVARFNNGTWRTTARGFNGDSPNKLLVMVDGRTVYSPLFTGVFWNVVDYVLDDTDRIEVIRGPGATLWGANAVNGVINIITRHSRDTQGALVSLSSGNEDPAIAEVRYGGDTTGTVTWRVYGKFARRDGQLFASGQDARDPRQRGQAGFRVDGGNPDRTTWLLKGDAFHSRDAFADRPDGEFTDLNLQGRVSRPLAGASRLDVQSYYRREYRRVPNQLTHHIDVFDVDAQHAITPTPRHNVVWGGGVRINADGTHGSAVIRFEPPERTSHLWSAFAQDEIALVPGRLSTTIGAKYEHNTFSGGEFQPNIRGRFMLRPDHVVWAAVSRAVRRPTRLDDDVVVTTAAGLPLIRGTGDFEAEELTAYELGYRAQLLPRLAADATVFHHDFDKLRSQDLPPAGGFPLVIANTLEGTSSGVELAVRAQPLDPWQVHVSYTYLTSEARRAPGSRDVSGGAAEANDPEYLFDVRSSLDLPRAIQVDAMLRSVGELEITRVPAYTELNLRVGWLATPRAEFWAAGQDLLHDHHPEFGAPTPTRIEFERSLRAGITLRY